MFKYVIIIITAAIGFMNTKNMLEVPQALPEQKDIIVKEKSRLVASAQDTALLPLAQDLGPVRNSNIADPEIQSKAVLIKDLETGKILYSKNEHERLPIASITKLMTAQIIIDRMNLDDVVTMSKMAINTYGGQAFFIGEKLNGRSLFKAMLMASSNDAAVALAEHTSGTWQEFVALMNNKVAQLRLFDTHFANPTGLDDTENYSTASDMAVISEESLKYSLIWETMRIQETIISSSDGVQEHALHNSNKLLGKLPHITGGKTGYTDMALETFVFVVGSPNAISSEENHQVLYVILGTPIGLRFQETQNLVKWVDKAYKW